MIKKLMGATLWSVLVFATISYTSVMVSLLETTLGDLGKPVTNIGFPWRYYYQFWMNGSDGPNCGWHISHFFWDAALTWLVVTTIYFLRVSRRGRKT